MHKAALRPPLDPLPKVVIENVGYWENGGQVADLEDVPLNEFKFCSEGVVPRTGFMDGGHLAFVREILATDSLGADTLFRYDMIPVDALPVHPIGVEASHEYRNFYTGYTMPSGVEGMHRYRYVVYEDLWPGISMWFYADGHDQRMAFDCAPGSDPGLIKFEYVGQLSAVLDSAGNTLIDLGSMEQTIPAPLIYNVVNGQAVILPEQGSASMVNVPGSGNYVNADIFEYGLPAVEPDPGQETVVLFGSEAKSTERSGTDGLCWSTYYGGDRFDGVNESATDEWDNYYVTGWTLSTYYTFSHGIGGPLVYNFGSYYATTSQFDSDERLIWTTYLGAGHSTQIYSYALAIKRGSPSPIYFGGIVSSHPNMFTTAPSSAAYLDNTPSPNSTTGFICRLKMNGFVDWSTYWGDYNTTLYGMAVSERRLVITGGTYSILPTPANPAPYPASYLPPSPNIGDAADAYVAAFDYSERTHWVSYLAGELGEGGYDVRSTSNGEVYVYGGTQSPNFYTHYLNGAFNDNTFGGGTQYSTDAFIARFSNMFEIKWCSYFGGADGEEAGRNGLAISPVKDEVYIVGTIRYAQPAPSGFPLHPHANGLAYFDGVKEPGSNGYIAHFRGGTDELIWCTYFGDFDYFHNLETVTADNYGLIYVGGETASPNLPVMQSTNYAYYQPSIVPNDGIDNDGFIAMFKPIDDVMNWCTYFGGRAGTIPEYLTTLVAKETALFAGGRTSKHSDLSSYFPLQYNGIPGSYYQDVFGDFINPTADGFLSKFCTPWSTIAAEQRILPNEVDGTGNVDHWVEDDQLCIGSMGQGQRVKVFGCDGRLLMETPVAGSANTSVLRIPLAGLSPGIYIVRTALSGTFKFFRP